MKLQLTGSEAADSPQLPGLISGIPAQAVLGDKGYDSDANRAAIRKQGAEPCIPSRKNRKQPIPYDRHLYGARNVMGMAFLAMTVCLLGAGFFGERLVDSTSPCSWARLSRSPRA